MRVVPVFKFPSYFCLHNPTSPITHGKCCPPKNTTVVSLACSCSCCGELSNERGEAAAAAASSGGAAAPVFNLVCQPCAAAPEALPDMSVHVYPVDTGICRLDAKAREHTNDHHSYVDTSRMS